MGKILYTKTKFVYDLGNALIPIAIYLIIIIGAKALSYTQNFELPHFLSWVRNNQKYANGMAPFAFAAVVLMMSSLSTYKVKYVNNCLKFANVFGVKKKFYKEDYIGFNIQDSLVRAVSKGGSGYELPAAYLWITLIKKDGTSIALPSFKVELFDGERLKEVEQFFKEIWPENLRQIEYLEEKISSNSEKIEAE